MHSPMSCLLSCGSMSFGLQLGLTLLVVVGEFHTGCVDSYLCAGGQMSAVMSSECCCTCWAVPGHAGLGSPVSVCHATTSSCGSMHYRQVALQAEGRPCYRCTSWQYLLQIAGSCVSHRQPAGWSLYWLCQVSLLLLTATLVRLSLAAAVYT